MKTASDDLFRLIKSLNQTEKRYFKVFAGRHVVGEVNNYVRLFDAIDSLKVYDEEIVKKKFKDEVFVNYFAAEKKHLYNTIIESLQSYTKDISIDYILRKEVNAIEILYNKGLWDLCSKKVIKAKKAAQLHEKYLLHLELLSWERMLINRGVLKQNTLIDQKKHSREEVLKIKELNNLYAYKALFSKITSFTSYEGEARSDKMIKEFKFFMNHPLLADEKKTLSKRAKIFYYQIFQFYYHYIQEDEAKRLNYSDKLHNLITSFPELIEENPARYITAIYNRALISIKERDETSVRKALDQLQFFVKKLPKNKNVLQRIWRYSFTIESDWCIQTGRFDGGLGLIKKNEEQLQELVSYLDTSGAIIIYYNVVIIYFGTSRYREALKWLNKLLNNGKSLIQEDIFIVSMILKIIIHYELKNTELLKYIVKSTERSLRKKQKLYAIETAILNFFGKNIFEGPIENQLKEFKKELIAISKNPHERKLFDYFDFLNWVQSKLDKKSFGEIIMENNSRLPGKGNNKKSAI